MKSVFKVVLLLFNVASFSQATMPLSDPELINQQLRIGISKLVNSAFPSDKNAYTLEYRYNYSAKNSIRTGLIYETEDSANGFVELGVKIGIDRIYRKYAFWTFYYGIDFMTNYTNFKNINKDIYGVAIAPLFGIQYNLSKNFSISVEPMVYYRQTFTKDNATFNDDKTTSFAESGLGKIGYVQLNFHF